MVETDIGDDREVGRDDVGAVETSSKAYLDDGHIDLLLGKVVEGHGRGELEEGGMERLEE